MNGKVHDSSGAAASGKAGQPASPGIRQGAAGAGPRASATTSSKTPETAPRMRRQRRHHGEAVPAPEGPSSSASGQTAAAVPDAGSLPPSAGHTIAGAWQALIKAGPAGLVHALLPVAIVAAGTAYAAFGAQSPLAAALATLVTSSLAGLALLAAQARQIAMGRRMASMRARFESLEDRAWELRESEERYRSLAEAFGDLLVVHDEDGRIIHGNAAYAACLGIDPSGLPGLVFDAGSSGPPGETASAGSLLGSGVREACIRTGEGERWFAWLDLPMRDERKGRVTLSVARDVTAFRRAEAVLEDARGRAEQASLAKSRFLAMASHEMRTPLNGILGMSRLLAETGLSAEQDNYNRAVITSGEALLGLIGDMLDLTMIEAGRFTLREANFSLRRTLDGIAELLAPRAHDKGLGLGLHVEPGLPDELHGDAGRLRQILVNLAGNAIKYTPSGGVALRVRAGEADAAGAIRLVFEVHDTGPGLASGDRERIFAEFERTDADVIRRTDGAGLGLAISRAIAAQMGGTVELAETSPEGSLFRLSLPLASAPADAMKPGNASATGPLLAGTTHVVLAAFHSLETDALADRIAAEGIACRRMKTPASARRWLARAPAPRPSRQRNLLLADADLFIAMPQHGHREIAALASAGWQIVLLLQPSHRRHLDGWLKAGATNWLMRPVREESLLFLLRGDAGQMPQIKGEAREEHAGTSPDRTPGRSLHEPVSGTGRKRGPDNEASILLAEDNDINALLVHAALSRGGFALDRARNGEEAVRMHEAALEAGRPYRMILMDLHMPVMDGESACRAIRAHERRLQLPPATIIALTADEQGSARQGALEAGIDQFLVKPVDPALLVQTAAEALAGIQGEETTPDHPANPDSHAQTRTGKVSGRKH